MSIQTGTKINTTFSLLINNCNNIGTNFNKLDYIFWHDLIKVNKDPNEGTLNKIKYIYILSIHDLMYKIFDIWVVPRWETFSPQLSNFPFISDIIISR